MPTGGGERWEGVGIIHTVQLMYLFLDVMDCF